MNLLLSVLLILSMVGPVERGRLLEQDVNNLLQYQEHINHASSEFDVPQWIIAGVMFNESNFRPLKRGNNTGHGQINCRVWSKMLRNHGIIHKCSDLLEAETSIRAVAFILNHLKHQPRSKVKNRLDWPSILSYYRHGYRWSQPDKGYFNRVYFFGKNTRSYWTTRTIKWCQR